MNFSRCGVDLAKRVIQVHGVDERAGAHYWARQLAKSGHTVKLIAAQFVIPYRRCGKNDANDAQAICEAVGRPSMHFVAVKTEEQQEVLTVHRARSLVLANRTAQIEQMRELDEHVSKYDLALRELARQSEPARRLMKVESIGPMTATAIVASMGDPRVFKSGRNYAASIGLTPREHSSGCTNRLGPITKQGDPYLRTLLVHGARSHLRTVDRKTDAKSAWARRSKERRHANVAAVALAAKHARIAWALLAKGIEFRPAEPEAAAA